MDKTQARQQNTTPHNQSPCHRSINLEQHRTASLSTRSLTPQQQNTTFHHSRLFPFYLQSVHHSRLSSYLQVHHSRQQTSQLLTATTNLQPSLTQMRLRDTLWRTIRKATNNACLSSSSHPFHISRYWLVTPTSTATLGATPTPAGVTCGAHDEAPHRHLLLRLGTSSSCQTCILHIMSAKQMPIRITILYIWANNA